MFFISVAVKDILLPLKTTTLAVLAQRAEAYRNSEACSCSLPSVLCRRALAHVLWGVAGTVHLWQAIAAGPLSGREWLR